MLTHSFSIVHFLLFGNVVHLSQQSSAVLDSLVRRRRYLVKRVDGRDVLQESGPTHRAVYVMGLALVVVPEPELLYRGPESEQVKQKLVSCCVLSVTWTSGAGH